MQHNRLIFLLAIFVGGSEALRMHDRKSDVESASQSQYSAKVNAMFFDIGKCILNYPELIRLANEGQQTCEHAFSCVGAFSIDITTELKEGMFCSINAWEMNVPLAVRQPIANAYADFLNKVMIPQWEIVLKMNSMIPAKRFPWIPGSSFWQKEDCSGEELPVGKMQCMMKQAKELKESTGGKIDFHKVQMTEAQAHEMKEKFKRLHEGLSIMQTDRNVAQEKFRALEQGPGAATSIAGLYLTEEDDVPIPGPLTTSLISPPSASRFAHTAKYAGLEMTKYKLTDQIDAARCNDGTSALYYMKAGDTNKFHFHVAGGYFCNSPRSCRKRIRGAPMLASNAGYEDTYDGTGIFDPVNGGLPGWTHSYIPYCSSDAWFGQVDLPDFQVVNNTYIKPGVTGTFFRGHTMLDAMMKKYAEMGLGSAEGQEFVISACSAGAIGVAAQADSFLKRLKEQFQIVSRGPFFAPKLTIVLDNMPVISPKPLTINFNGNVSLFDQSQKLVDMLYVKPGILGKASEFLNKECVAANGGSPAACVYPGVVMPFIQANNLILNNLQDSFLLYNPASITIPLNAEQEQYMYNNDRDIREVIDAVTPQQNQWATACNDHCLALFPTWWRFVPTTSTKPEMRHLSPKDMMLMTMQGDTNHVARDECWGYMCGCAGFGPFYRDALVQQLGRQVFANIFPASQEVYKKTYDTYNRLPREANIPAGAPIPGAVGPFQPAREGKKSYPAKEDG